jgi:hypothetical protein
MDKQHKSYKNVSFYNFDKFLKIENKDAKYQSCDLSDRTDEFHELCNKVLTFFFFFLPMFYKIQFTYLDFFFRLSQNLPF